MISFLKHKLPQLNQEEWDHLNSHIMFKDTKIVMWKPLNKNNENKKNKPPEKEIFNPDCFKEFYQIISQFCTTSFRKCKRKKPSQLTWWGQYCPIPMPYTKNKQRQYKKKRKQQINIVHKFIFKNPHAHTHKSAKWIQQCIKTDLELFLVSSKVWLALQIAGIRQWYGQFGS